MNILIIHAHTANRGDESAIKAMVDEILLQSPDMEITISQNGITPYPNMPSAVKQIGRFPAPHSLMGKIDFALAMISNGHIAITHKGRNFLSNLKKADLVIHAPGGPSIGDTYREVENLYSMRLNLARRMKKHYMFYAPSMGPFQDKKRNPKREKVLRGADKIILRDPISIQYLHDFLPDIQVEHAFDSALQHDVDTSVVSAVYEKYDTLREFISLHDKCIGITITDLKWHPRHKDDFIAETIITTFHHFIEQKVDEGYGIVFIPQLYGTGNDTDLMKKFMLKEHTFMVDAFDDDHDSYFQQYVIGQLYAVVGMRYHSNIFSAKMGTPFVSIAYEQKMSGFMQSIGLSDYCLDLNELSCNTLNDKFNSLEENYSDYKNKLIDLHDYMKKESHKSTDAVFEILEGK